MYALCTPYKISSIRTILATIDKYSDCFHCPDACLNQFVSIAYILKFQNWKGAIQSELYHETFKVAICDLKYYSHVITSAVKECHRDSGASDWMRLSSCQGPWLSRRWNRLYRLWSGSGHAHSCNVLPLLFADTGRYVNVVFEVQKLHLKLSKPGAVSGSGIRWRRRLGTGSRGRRRLWQSGLCRSCRRRW